MLSMAWTSGPADQGVVKYTIIYDSHLTNTRAQLGSRKIHDVMGTSQHAGI